MIFITGDCHGDRVRIRALSNVGGRKLTDRDYVIICGDFGYIFDNNRRENEFLDEMEKMPFTICFVDGNHENFPAIYSYPLTYWNGGKAHRIRNNIFHLARGQVFKIDGKSFFTMGGAYSIDCMWRLAGRSWWAEELPCDREYKEAVENLKRYDMKVDYILTHTIPTEMIYFMGVYPNNEELELTGFLEWIMQEVKYKKWFRGHWHQDKLLPNNIRLLWFDTEKIE